MQNSEYRKNLENLFLAELKNTTTVLAAWEAGSAANKSLDEYSDLDLCILSSGNAEEIFTTLELILKPFVITHTWRINETVSSGVNKRIYFLKDSPKYFFLDVSIFPNSPKLFIEEILEVERHGIPKIYFDKDEYLKIRNVDEERLRERLDKRLREIVSSFPVFKTIVLKEIERGNSLDAFGFYQGGLVKPLVELLGMTHRPHQYDFGLRYINRSFPREIQNQLKNICYISDFNELPKRIQEIENLVTSSLDQLKKQS